MTQDSLKLLKTVAHQFRTPLNTINGLINSMVDEDIDSSINSKMEIIKQCSDHLNELIQNIHEFSFNTNRPLKDDVIQLNSILKRCATSYSYNINKNAIITDCNVSEKLYGNEEILSLIINNIINNSITYTNNGTITISAVMISTENNSSKIRISIKDSLDGVNQKQRDNIYSNFIFIESKANSAFNLNSILLHKNIKLCNGTIISTPNRENSNAFVFDITLNNSINTVKKQNLNTPKKISILLVEDNKLNQILTKRLLEKSGHKCVAVNNGLEAVEEIKKRKYDLILMDLMMPIMDGYEATNIIKKTDPKSKIIALTAIPELNQIKNTSLQLFDFIMRKPFKPTELFNTIETIISNTQTYKAVI